MRHAVPDQGQEHDQGQSQDQSRSQDQGHDQSQEHGAGAGRSPVTAAARAVSALAHGHRPGLAREHRAARRPRRTGDWAKRYKIQAMITLLPPQDGAAEPALTGPTCRAVIRARHHVTHAGKFFSALVDIRDEYAVPDASHLVVTAVVLGDDAGDYLSVGDEFALWRGCDIGQGVVTRRVFV